MTEPEDETGRIKPEPPVGIAIKAAPIGVVVIPVPIGIIIITVPIGTIIIAVFPIVTAVAPIIVRVVGVPPATPVHALEWTVASGRDPQTSGCGNRSGRPRREACQDAGSHYRDEVSSPTHVYAPIVLRNETSPPPAHTLNAA
jgi:hypothetical protein